MNNIITFLATGLGTIAPFLFALTLNRGLQRSSLPTEKKASLKTVLVATLIFWTAGIWAAGWSGMLTYQPGDQIPRFVVPLIIPFVVSVVLVGNIEFRKIVDSIPLALLVGMQAFRLMGVAFLLAATEGTVPAHFALGGYGDIITGLLAILSAIMIHNAIRGARFVTWLFTLIGLADLMNVATLLLIYYPIWCDLRPSSAAATDFPAVLVLGLAAPIALTCHFYVVRELILRRSQTEHPTDPSPHNRQLVS